MHGVTMKFTYTVYVENDYFHLSDTQDFEGTEPPENSIINFN